MNDKIKYFFPKIKNRIPFLIARISERLPLNEISCLGLDDISGKANFIQRLEDMLGSCLQDYICSGSKVEKELIISRASNSKQHIFDVLGSGPIKMERIQWSKEIKTGYQWPVGVYYLKIRSMTPKGSDIKVPWEISRCHHLLWMAEAYCITNDESYALEIVTQIRDWIKNNPMMYSVNWTCAMDVAIRAINWMYSLVLIGKSYYLTDEFAKEVYVSLYQHLFFINRNLEKNIPYSNNHYFSDIVGQLYLGQLFSSTRYGKKTLKRAIKEYIREIELQILPSGVDYERSVSYHRLMTELALYPYYMLSRIGQKLPQIVLERISRMIGYISQYTMANGSSPLVSDNDDGRLLPFVPYPFIQHSYLIDPNSIDSHISAHNCHWIGPAYANTCGCVHTDANIVVMRNQGMFLFTSCFNRWRYDTSIQGFIGTHLHNDLLSFVFADGDTPIIVDPGAYCYTSNISAWKNFRSAKKHNTVIVDDEEPNLLGNSTFLMKYNTHSKSMSYIPGQIEHCEGEYTTIEGKMTHHRSFDLSSNDLIITDLLSKQGKGHKAYMSFHYNEGVNVEIKNNSITLMVGEKQYRMIINIGVPYNAYTQDDTISPSFGVLKKAITLIVEFEFDNQVICTTKIIKI